MPQGPPARRPNSLKPTPGRPVEAEARPALSDHQRLIRRCGAFSPDIPVWRDVIATQDRDAPRPTVSSSEFLKTDPRSARRRYARSSRAQFPYGGLFGFKNKACPLGTHDPWEPNLPMSGIIRAAGRVTTRPFSGRTLVRRRGSDMKFEPTRLADYTDEALLAEIQRVANLVGPPSLRAAAFTQHARVGLTTLRRRFGGWREALEAAGLGVRLPKEVAPARISRTRAGRMDRRQDRRGTEASRHPLLRRQSLTVDDFKKHATIGPDAVRARFGGWPQALRAAGLEPVNHGKRYSDEACLENLLAVWTHYGRPPKYQEMNKTPSAVGGKAYMKRWGTWNRAVHAFTDYVESEARASSTEIRPPEPSGAGPVNTLWRNPKTAEIPRSASAIECCAETDSAAFPVGGVRATDSGCELHVDHVIPFSKGGKTTFENLRALCAECNLGKGSTLENDA